MKTLRELCLAVVCILLTACGGGGGSGSDGDPQGKTGAAGGQSSNKARFSFDCDLNCRRV